MKFLWHLLLVHGVGGQLCRFLGGMYMFIFCKLLLLLYDTPLA